MFEWVRCVLDEHAYVRDERIESYTYGRDDEICGRCTRCSDVVWIDMGDTL